MECRIMTQVYFVQHLPLLITVSTILDIGKDKILLEMLLANYDINHIIQITFPSMLLSVLSSPFFHFSLISNFPPLSCLHPTIGYLL